MQNARQDGIFTVPYFGGDILYRLDGVVMDGKGDLKQYFNTACIFKPKKKYIERNTNVDIIG